MSYASVIEELETEQEVSVEPPKLYSVIVHNDDVTTMDFVVLLLCQIFNKSTQDAAKLTLTVHEEGQAIAGIYTKEVADQKVKESAMLSNQHGYPLKVTSEEAGY